VSFSCEGCGGILRFKTQAELDQHMALMHRYLLHREPPVPGDSPNRVEVPVATKPRRADPASCKFCLKLGEPCKRHGGKDHSASFRHRGTRATPAVPRKPGTMCGWCKRSDGTHSVKCPRRHGKAIVVPVKRKVATSVRGMELSPAIQTLRQRIDADQKALAVLEEAQKTLAAI
jgi:hypothetical protein